MNSTRFHIFANRFRGYQFYNKKTLDMIPKWQIFVTYFRAEYTTDANTVEFINEDKRAKFDQIVLEHGGALYPVDRHPYYGIRNTIGWRDGKIENPECFFERSHPTQDVLRTKEDENLF